MNKRLLLIALFVCSVFIVGCSHPSDKYMVMPANQNWCSAHEGGVFINGQQTNITNAVYNVSVSNCCCTPKINEYDFTTCICFDDKELGKFMRGQGEK